MAGVQQNATSPLYPVAACPNALANVLCAGNRAAPVAPIRYNLHVTNIIDNRTVRLADAVRGLLADGATHARFAVGYLFLEGLVPLREQLARLEETRLLIGNVVSRLTEEQVREEAAARARGGEDWVRDQEDIASTLRETHTRAASVTALSLRQTLSDMARTPDTRALLLTLARRIADGGLQVRLYTEGRMHAKIALLSYAEGVRDVAIVGSGNLTLGGPAHPTEMNIIVRDAESVAALSAWYDGLWEQSQDFHRELFDELGHSWAMQPSSVQSPQAQPVLQETA